MSALLLPRTWGGAALPAGPALNSGHPLAAGLVGGWFLGTGGGSLVPNLAGAPTYATSDANVTRGMSMGAPSGIWTTGTSGIVTARSGPLLGGQVNWSIVARIFFPTTGGSGRAIYCERAASGNDILKLDYQGLSGAALDLTYRNDAGTLIQLAGGNIHDGAPHQVAGTKRGTDCRIYVDGVQVNQGTFGSGSDAFTNAGLVSQIGADAGDTNAFWLGSIAYVLVYARVLGLSELEWLRAEPTAVIAPPRPFWAVAVASANQFARPASDIAAGTWTPTTGTDLYAMLDETPASDTDYIQSGLIPTADVCEVRLTSLTDPASSTGHVVRYRLRKPL